MNIITCLWLLGDVFFIVGCGQRQPESHSSNQTVELLDYMITHTDFSNKDILFRAEVFRQKHKGNGNQDCLWP